MNAPAFRFLGMVTIGILAAVISNAAAASRLTFDLTRSTDGNEYSPSFTFTETEGTSSVVLTVSSPNGEVSKNQFGLGVRDGADKQRIGSDGSLNEVLDLVFSPAVTLLDAIVLEHAGDTESFQIIEEDGTFHNYTISDGDPTQGGSSLVTLAGLNFTGSKFSFRHTDGSGIRINQVAVSPVPLPAAVWMFISALVMVSGIGRVKAARTQAH